MKGVSLALVRWSLPYDGTTLAMIFNRIRDLTDPLPMKRIAA
jgi:hypothetical protein